MKKVLVGIVLGVLVISLQAAPDPVPETNSGAASGKGRIRFGHDGAGIGLFDFQVVSNREIKGRILFAGEHHDHYPDVIVRMQTPERANFNGRTARFTGRGTLHDEEVNVIVMAWDGSGTEKADWLHVHVTNDDGEELLHVQGDVFDGDIVVGHDS